MRANFRICTGMPHQQNHHFQDASSSKPRASNPKMASNRSGTEPYLRFLGVHNLYLGCAQDLVAGVLWELSFEGEYAIMPYKEALRCMYLDMKTWCTKVFCTPVNFSCEEHCRALFTRGFKGCSAFVFKIVWLYSLICLGKLA